LKGLTAIVVAWVFLVSKPRAAVMSVNATLASRSASAVTKTLNGKVVVPSEFTAWLATV
jgi:hypothetical protein